MTKPLIAMMAAALLAPMNRSQAQESTRPTTAEASINPILKKTEPGFLYCADPSAEVFEGKVYVYCSRDQEDAVGYSSMQDYVVLESSDLKSWTNHGVVLKPRTDKGFEWATGQMNAPDAAFKDGWYYLYFPYDKTHIGVAKSKSPTGPWEPALRLEQAPMTTIFDPTVFVDDDGQAYIYGNDTKVNIGDKGRHVMGAKLKPNMVEIDGEWHRLSEEEVNEAVTIFKRNGIYYFMARIGAQTGYFMADNPLPYPGNPDNAATPKHSAANGYASYKGMMAAAAPSAPNHTSAIEFQGQWYLFYHRGDVNEGTYHRRSACVDPIEFNKDGTIKPMRYTLEDDRQARMAWWRDAKFGMFIHWGVYSVPAGFYQDKPVRGIGEWIMLRGKIPVDEYKAYAKDFNPTQFDAEAWVSLAKDAGMKYIVITAKHHDGFAMYPSKVSGWNLHDATPFKRDPLQELAEACRKHGIQLGFYYSQAQDWINGGAAAGGNWDPAQQRDMDEYVDKVAVPQVKELLTNYGEFPAILWWDTPGREPNPNINQAQAERLYNVAHSLRPNMIQNDRLGGSFEGDTVTPEQRIPPEGYPGKDWETCMTINGTWGFKKDDENWKSTETLIRNLCDIASKGGNYLLNVGPTAEGVIPEPSVDRLKDVGDWMKVNGEAVYGSKGSPFHQVHGTYDAAKLDRHGQPTFTPTWDWRCTSKPGQLYLMIFDWPSDGVFKLDGLQSKAIRASILGSDAAVDLSQDEQGLTLRLPKVAADPIATVVRVEIADDVARVATQSTK